MQIRFANSAFIPVPEILLLRGGRLALRKLRVRYGIVEHPDFGLIVIDGGYSVSLHNARAPSKALRRFARHIAPHIVDGAGPAITLDKLGYKPQQVGHVILTGLQLDHIGYLDDFPNAVLHVMRSAVRDLQENDTSTLARRGIFKELMTVDLAPRARFIDRGRRLELPFELGEGIDILGDASVLAVPLPGPTPGHAGVLFPHRRRPLLYAADAAWTMAGLLDGRERDLLADRLAVDPDARIASADRLWRFHRLGGDIVLCHDPEESGYDLREFA